MIYDLMDTDYDVRLITRNVMAVFSSTEGYVSHFTYKIKHTEYLVRDKRVKAESVVSFINRDYNINSNIFRYVKKRFNIQKFTEYLNYFGKNHLLWLHFSDLEKEDKLLVEILIALLKNKPITVLDYFDDMLFASNMISLLFKIGLEDRLIIYPCRNVSFGISNSTCQCYVKSFSSAKIQSRFSEEYLIEELLRPDIRYTSIRPSVYMKNDHYIVPISYKYSLYELLMIFIFSVRLLFIKAFNWSVR